ncbi:Putative AC transposase [Apostasia shenzhenica]|uniref:AC transposase n=1 Tax=Apostasia shenzhenica TaxID=1088818 RepID=A0A2H9ZYT5_9ASPA|nr:Putative AC transposase [Apostasia shenzhenica]
MLWAFRNDTARRGLVRFVVRTEQPFTISEKEGFLEYIVQYLQPQYIRISRHTLKKDCMSMYDENRKSLIEHLSNISCRVSLTSDIWTSITQKFDDDISLLEWWKSSSKQYSILSALTRDVLAAQASTVASESAFSTTERIVGDYRSSLSPATLCMLTCLQDWFAAESRNQQYNFVDEFKDNSSEEEGEYSRKILYNYDE